MARRPRLPAAGAATGRIDSECWRIDCGPGATLRPLFTADSRFVVFSIEPTKADLNKAKKDKKRPDDMPKNALGIMELSGGQVARVERVKSFQVPEDGGGFIAYLLEAKPDSAREGAAPGRKPDRQGGCRFKRDFGSTTRIQPRSWIAIRARWQEKEYGTDLVLRNTTTGAERTFTDVLDYTLSKDAKSLVYTVSCKE